MIDANILTAPRSTELTKSATNLVHHLSTRSARNEYPPIVYWDKMIKKVRRGNFESCFVTTDKEMVSDNLNESHMFVLGFDLVRKSKVEQLLIVQDMYDGNHSKVNEYFAHFHVYVGMSKDWRQNRKCPGGPWSTLKKVHSQESGWKFDPMKGEYTWKYG